MVLSSVFSWRPDGREFLATYSSGDVYVFPFDACRTDDSAELRLSIRGIQDTSLSFDDQPVTRNGIVDHSVCPTSPKSNSNQIDGVNGGEIKGSLEQKPPIENLEDNSDKCNIDSTTEKKPKNEEKESNQVSKENKNTTTNLLMTILLLILITTAILIVQITNISLLWFCPFSCRILLVA